jgi:hypothetical protein
MVADSAPAERDRAEPLMKSLDVPVPQTLNASYLISLAAPRAREPSALAG